MCNVVVPRKAAYFADHMVSQFDEAFVIGDHTLFLSVNAAAPDDAPGPAVLFSKNKFFS